MTTPETEFSFLDLPDDELHKYSIAPSTGSASTVVPSNPVEVIQPADTDPAVPADPAPEDSPEEVIPPENEEVAPTDPAPVPKEEVIPPKDAVKPVEKELPKDEKKEVPAETPNYEAEYKRLMSGFKANGKEITPRSVEDAIALMQMGANYNKKMSSLKPHLSVIKLLEQNGLLDMEKINNLIDLSKKDKAAITKLVKDAGIDPMDIDTSKEVAYKPTDRRVDPKELELDSVLEEIQGTESYQKTARIVSQEWDNASKQAIADQPAILRVLNSHVQAGIYDVITAEVERERLFGRLSGMSDLEAYRQVGDALHARGGFDHLTRQMKPEPTKQVVVAPNPKPAKEDPAKDRRRAAAPTKAITTTAPAKAQDDFLALSDEEFAKLKPRYL